MCIPTNGGYLGIALGLQIFGRKREEIIKYLIEYIYVESKKQDR